jgi:hypothetical protein
VIAAEVDLLILLLADTFQGLLDMMRRLDHPPGKMKI